MIVGVIILAIIVLIVFLNQASKQQAKQEVQTRGGLRNIFSDLDETLINNGFIFYSDQISTVQYRRIINDNLYKQFILKKTISLPDPYEIQLFLIENEKIKGKSLPIIIAPTFSFNKFQDIIFNMEQEANGITTNYFK